MTVIDIGEKKEGAWFEMEGGGRVQLRTLTGDDMKEIRKLTVKKRVEYARVDGKPERFAVEEVNEDLQNEMFWDAAIQAWENISDVKGIPIPCTKENKTLLMNRSVKFAKFIGDSLKTISDDETLQAEEAEKN